MTAFNEDEFEQAFPGCDFVHVVRVVTALQLGAAKSVLEGVERAGCGLSSFRISTRDDRLEHLFHLKGIRASDVRRLASLWRAERHVLHVDVEHKIIPGAPAAPRLAAPVVA